jgi:hypothetical protein
VLLAVHSMTDGGRAKLNELHVYAHRVDPTGSESAGTPFDGMYSGHVVKYLLTTEFGLSTSLFTLTDEGRQFEDLTLAKGTAERVLRDLCTRTGCQVVFGLDHKVEHRYDPLYPLSVLADIEVEWDRDNARKVEGAVPYRHNVSQVVIRAKSPSSDDVWEAKYPDTPLALGSPVEVEGAILGSADEAKLMAHRIFHQRNAPEKVTLTAVGPGEWLRPGMRCTLTWTADLEGTKYQGRNFVISSVHYRMKLGRVTDGGVQGKDWSTTIRLKQLEF